MLNKKLDIVGIVIGGGYGYDSIKYKGTGMLGDLDYLAVLEDISDFASFAQDKDLIKDCGFELSQTNSYYAKDLELFESGVVSVLRFSGINNGLKTTLNFTTINRLRSIYSQDSQERAYKIAHGKSQNILIAKGTDGSDLIVALIAPEVSSWFPDGVKHFLIPDHTWYERDGFLHAGILTDFIAKGRISETKEGSLSAIQGSILGSMKRRASAQISESKEWHLMLASNNYFSQEFKDLINRKVDDIIVEAKKGTAMPSQQRRLAVVFAEDSYYTSDLLSKDSIEYRSPDKMGKKLQDLFFSELSYDEILHLINSEAKRLSILLSLSKSYNEFSLPKDVTYNHLNFLPKDELVSDTEEMALRNVHDYIIENSKYDYSQLIHTKESNKELLKFLTQARLALADRIQSGDETSLVYTDKYSLD
jgi:hypothetical protein